MLKPTRSVLVPSGSLAKMLTRDEPVYKRNTDYMPQSRVKRLSVKEPRKSATDKKKLSPDDLQQRLTRKIGEINFEGESFDHVQDFEESKYEAER